MTNDQIKEIALANGFKLKEQPDGTQDLNPYVYDFSRDLLLMILGKAVSDIYDVNKLVINPGERSVWISCMGRVDDIINDIKGVADD